MITYVVCFVAGYIARAVAPEPAAALQFLKLMGKEYPRARVLLGPLRALWAAFQYARTGGK